MECLGCSFGLFQQSFRFLSLKILYTNLDYLNGQWNNLKMETVNSYVQSVLRHENKLAVKILYRIFKVDLDCEFLA
jgi:hypothetical protein